MRAHKPLARLVAGIRMAKLGTFGKAVGALVGGTGLRALPPLGREAAGIYQKEEKKKKAYLS